MLDLRPESRKLPQQTFFRPTENWWRLLASTLWLRHRRYVDVGAGMGALTDAMVASGYACRGVDINTRDGQSERVELGHAQDLYLCWDDCAIVARPSHGLGLDIILKSLVGNSEVLYLGLPENVESDLFWAYHYEILATDVGEEGEVAVRVICTHDKNQTWRKIVTAHGQAEWWRDGGNKWLNCAGGGFPKGDEKILETRLLSDYYQLYSTPEEACDNEPVDLRNGWIDPEGTWYPARSERHATVLQELFGITEGRAEEIGFVRCYGYRETFYTVRDKITFHQRARLKRLGFDLRHDFEEERSTL